MNLIELGIARIGRVVEISGGDDYVRNRLYAMGLYPGVAAQVLRTAPGGDPYQLRIGGTLISVRAMEAARVLVEPID